MILSNLINILETFNESESLSNLLGDISKLDTKITAESVKFTNDTYCRNLIYRNNNFDVYLIGWLPNQETPYHSHPTGGCIMKILEGSLIENIKNKDNTISNYKRKTGDCSYIHDDIGIHTIKNDTNEKCISLHIYSPPSFYD